MKRLNPATGKLFEYGEMRADGYQFISYTKKLKKNGYFGELWKDAKNHNFTNCFNGAKRRAREYNLPFDIDRDYLKSIMTTHCPVFGAKFDLGRMGDGYDTKFSPSLDRVIPEYGYVKGNVVFISNLANLIKQNATETELFAVAHWLQDKRKEVLNAFKNKPAPVSAGPYIQGAVGAELGSFSTPWTWEDSDDPHHHCGTISGEDADHRTKASSGDSMGRGDTEVESPTTPEDSQDPGHSGSTVNSVEEFFERVRDQSRELDLVVGATRGAIQQSDHRRVESLQRSFNEKIQSLEETLKELREAHYPDGHTHPSGHG
jgi:hypothetical protein